MYTMSLLEFDTPDNAFTLESYFKDNKIIEYCKSRGFFFDLTCFKKGTITDISYLIAKKDTSYCIIIISESDGNNDYVENGDFECFDKYIISFGKHKIRISNFFDDIAVLELYIDDDVMAALKN